MRLVRSLANIIAVERAREVGVHLLFVEHARVRRAGDPALVPACAYLASWDEPRRHRSGAASELRRNAAQHSVFRSISICRPPDSSTK
jgi:hypothetical protein